MNVCAWVYRLVHICFKMFSSICCQWQPQASRHSVSAHLEMVCLPLWQQLRCFMDHPCPHWPGLPRLWHLHSWPFLPGLLFPASQLLSRKVTQHPVGANQSQDIVFPQLPSCPSLMCQGSSALPPGGKERETAPYLHPSLGNQPALLPCPAPIPAALWNPCPTPCLLQPSTSCCSSWPNSMQFSNIVSSALFQST